MLATIAFALAAQVIAPAERPLSATGDCINADPKMVRTVPGPLRDQSIIRPQSPYGRSFKGALEEEAQKGDASRSTKSCIKKIA